MKRLLRHRPSPAMIVAVIALFLAMGGVGYAAATIRSGDVVNNTLRSRDIRNNTVLGKDIRNRTIRGRDVRRNTLDGTRINESRLGVVPSAATADGHNFARIDYRAPSGTPTTTVLSMGGLLINATCRGGTDIQVSATTTTNNAMLHVGTNVAAAGNNRPAFYLDDNDLDLGQNVDLLPGRDNRVQGTLTYTTVSRSIVTVTFMAEEQTNALASGNDCFFVGKATQSG
jgi:hypothetical protein